jgi:hypothetical protein
MLSTATGKGSRVDDDDVSATVTISRRRSLDEALTMAGAAPVWNGNDERRPMLSTATGNGFRVDDDDVSATVTICFIDAERSTRH